jgi:hypothetical protein
LLLHTLRYLEGDSAGAVPTFASVPADWYVITVPVHCSAVVLPAAVLVMRSRRLRCCDLLMPIVERVTILICCLLGDGRILILFSVMMSICDDTPIVVDTVGVMYTIASTIADAVLFCLSQMPDTLPSAFCYGDDDDVTVMENDAGGSTDAAWKVTGD